MRISLVVAMSRNGLIGRDGGLPWRLPADLAHFKSVTMGHPIVMGRKTHESIGRPLPGRLNIVVTRRRGYTAHGCEVASSIDAAIEVAGDVDEIMVVGGAALYADVLPRAQRIYLTEVNADLAGDTFFPPFNREQWGEVSRESHSADDRNEFDYSFIVLDRITGD